MAGQPRPKASDTLAGRCPLLQGTFSFDLVVLHVQLTNMMVTQGLHRFVDLRGDDHLYNIAVLGWVHLHLGARGRRCPRSGPTGAPHQDGGRSRAGAGYPHGHGHVVHDPLQRGDEVGAPWVVSVLSWGKHRRTSSSERLVRIEGKCLGVPELFFAQGSLPDPFPDNCGLPQVC